ncbi:unnamed protein product, partial [Pelagomonas calceolata]
YVGRAETDQVWGMAINQLGNGLSEANHHEDALSVQGAELSMRQRLGALPEQILVMQTNLANTYERLGRREEAARMQRDVYSGCMRIRGEEDRQTFLVAENFALTLLRADLFEEAKSVLLKTVPVARRVLGESDAVTLKIRWCLAIGLYSDPGATLDDVREAVSTLEDIEPSARRVLGGSHPLLSGMTLSLQESRAVLRARETPSASAP